MTALGSTHARAIGPVAPRDQAWRLRALVESMSGAAQEAPRPAARRVPVVAIASGKGGVGKTNLAVNMCIALAGAGVRAALLDADLGMANADVLCGLTPGRRLDDVLREGGGGGANQANIDSCIVEAPGGFLLVPGAVGAARVAELGAAARARLIDQLARLEARSDLVVIDTGAGIGHDVLAFAAAADMLIVVVTPEPTALTDAYGLIKCLVSRGATAGGKLPRIAVVVNQMRERGDLESVSQRLTMCCSKFLDCHPILLGGIRADPRVGRAVRRRVPHMLGRPRTPASRDIHQIAAALRDALHLR